MYMQYFVGLTLVVCAVEGSLFRSDGPSIDPGKDKEAFSPFGWTGNKNPFYSQISQIAATVNMKICTFPI